LRNLTDAPLTAQAGLEGAKMQTVRLPAGSARDVRLPLELRKPGPAPATLAWGAARQPLQKVDLAITVPEPISVTGGSGFVSDGDTLEMPVAVNIAPGDRSRYRLRLLIAARQEPLTVELAARPGEEKRVRLSVRGSARLQTRLVDGAGRAVGQAIEGRVFALTE
jgi:hypothetical protein